MDHGGCLVCGSYAADKSCSKSIRNFINLISLFATRTGDEEILPSLIVEIFRND